METSLAKIQETIPTVFSVDVNRELYLGRKLGFHLFHDWWPFEKAQSPQSRVIPFFRSGIQMGQLLPALVHPHIQLCDPFCSRSLGPNAVVCVVCLVPPVFAGIPATPEVLYLFSEQTQKVPERFCRDLTVVFCCSRRRGWALE